MAINLNWAKRMVVDSLYGRNVKVALVAAYSENPAHEVWADVLVWEVAGSGYDTGGKAVALDVLTDLPTLSVQISSAPIAFGVLGVPQANGVIFYDDSGRPSTSRILAVDMFADGALAIDGTDFTYVPPGGVVLTLSTDDDLIIEP